MASQHRFTGVIKIAGINPYVDVPPRLVEALDRGLKVPVLVKVTAKSAADSSAAPTGGRLSKDEAKLKAIGRLGNDGWFRTTIISLKSSGRRLYLDTWMRDSAGVGVGDKVCVVLKPDHGSRDLPVPAELRKALDENSNAQAAWQALTLSRQREILTYLNFLKTPAALERNVQKTIASLVATDRGG